jgi:hypothetical protein
MPNNHAQSPSRDVVQKPRLRSPGSIEYSCYTISAENFKMNPNTTYPEYLARVTLNSRIRPWLRSHTDQLEASKTSDKSTLSQMPAILTRVRQQVDPADTGCMVY